MTVVASIDLSTRCGPVQLQGARPTCLAFALSELNQYANDTSSALSVEYLYRSAASRIAGWKVGAGLYLDPAFAAVSRPGQPAVFAYPYLSHEPAEIPPALPVLSSDERLYVGAVHKLPGSASAVEAELLGGTPVGLILRLTDTFLAPVQGTVHFSHMLLNNDMHHAVVATGLGKHVATNDPYIRIRNTWGEEWGDGGNAWLPFSYVNFHAITAFKVQ